MNENSWPFVDIYGHSCPFNPCCNGRWSLTNSLLMAKHTCTRLNPCFNGRWSLTWLYIILSAMKVNIVLILVLMEDGLWLWRTGSVPRCISSLNPCCSGRWSREEKQHVKGQRYEFCKDSTNYQEIKILRIRIATQMPTNAHEWSSIKYFMTIHGYSYSPPYHRKKLFTNL